MGQERFGVSGAVGADEDGGAVAVGVGDLGRCPVQGGDVIGRGAGAGVARPEPAGQRLTDASGVHSSRWKQESCVRARTTLVVNRHRR